MKSEPGSQGDASQAAQRAVSEDRLLPGEEAALTDLREGDVGHWVKVYEELVAGKLLLIDQVRGLISGATSSEAGAELRGDLAILEAEHTRLRHRLAFWRLLAAEDQEKGK